MMKKVIVLLLISLLCLPGFAVAQDFLGGEVIMETNYQSNQGSSYPDLLLKLNLDFSKTGFTNEFYTEVNITNNLNQNTLELGLDEAYYRYYAANYDLSVGQERVSWGTALKFNPTDNINPVDPKNIMGEKQPVVLVRGNYYLDNNLTITGVVIPYHKPARDEVELNGRTFIAEPVEDTLANTEYALKLSGRGIAGIDYSLSYFNGHEDMPFFLFTSTPQGPAPTGAYFRRFAVYGGDLATSIKGIGFWLEGAYMVPEAGREYYGLVMGADYKFPNNLYLQGQLIFQEDQWQNEDYLIQSTLELPLARIHFLRLGGIFNPEDGGRLYNTELEFSLANSMVLKIKYTNKEGSLFANEMKDNLLPDGQNVTASISYAF